MRVFVLNSGSSSLKFQLIDMPQKTLLAKGLVDRIGENGAGVFQVKTPNQEKATSASYVTHQEALMQIFSVLEDLIGSDFSIDAIGHRVVHGGEMFPESVRIDDGVIDGIEQLRGLAPLHNPANLMGIRACAELLPGVDQVACFDTSFHATLTPSRYLYPLPYDLYEKYHIRRYGFHGLSHAYVAGRISYLTDAKKIIVAHIGNGASITAIMDGVSVDTSMGFTPLEGLMMGTRSGSIDPAIPLFLINQGMSTQEVDTLMNKKSGVLGVFGSSGDLRDIGAVFDTDERAHTTIDMYTDRIAKTIASFAVSLGGVEAIGFTAGVGENSALIRGLVMDKLAWMGISYDAATNRATQGTETELSSHVSQIRVFVIPTNEEGKIAEETYRLCQKQVLSS